MRPCTTDSHKLDASMCDGSGALGQQVIAASMRLESSVVSCAAHRKELDNFLAENQNLNGRGDAEYLNAPVVMPESARCTADDEESMKKKCMALKRKLDDLRNRSIEIAPRTQGPLQQQQ